MIIKRAKIVIFTGNKIKIGNMYRRLRKLCWLSVAAWVACSSPSGNQDKIEGDSLTNNSYQKESTTSGHITIAVDETYKPILEAEIDNFEFLYENASVKAVYLPGEEAINTMLTQDSIRLVVSSRNLTAAEETFLEEQGTRARSSLIAADAVALIIHKSNTDSTLSSEQLEGILTGQIETWDQINPSSELGKILLAFDHAKSSTVRYLQQNYLNDRALRNDAFAAKSNPDVLSYVSQTPNAIGVIGLSWISDQDDKQAISFRKDIRVMELEAVNNCSFIETYKVNFFQPYQGVISEGCYPLSRNIYAVLREPRVGLGTGFVAHLASDEGQRIFHKAGLVPEKAITRVVRFPEK